MTTIPEAGYIKLKEELIAAWRRIDELETELARVCPYHIFQEPKIIAFPEQQDIRLPIRLSLAGGTQKDSDYMKHRLHLIGTCYHARRPPDKLSYYITEEALMASPRTAAGVPVGIQFAADNIAYAAWARFKEAYDD